MTKDEFVETVIIRLKNRAPNSENVSEEEWAMEHTYVASLYRDGFTVQDATRMCLLSEEMNPELAEDHALREMDKIRKRYSK